MSKEAFVASIHSKGSRENTTAKARQSGSISGGAKEPSSLANSQRTADLKALQDAVDALIISEEDVKREADQAEVRGAMAASLGTAGGDDQLNTASSSSKGREGSTQM